MAKSQLKLVAPNTENRTVVMPRRKPNAELRTREYLTDAEVEGLTEAAKGNRYGHRDATMILMATVTASARASLWTCVGIRSTSTGQPWPSGASSRVASALIPSRV